VSTTGPYPVKPTASEARTEKWFSPTPTSPEISHDTPAAPSASERSLAYRKAPEIVCFTTSCEPTVNDSAAT